MSNKTIHNIIEDTKKLLEQNLLPNAPFQNRSILTEETLNEQLESQANNGREEAAIFYLTAPLINKAVDGIPEINLNIESVWVNKETLEIVEEPEWRKEEIRQRRQKMKEEDPYQIMLNTISNKSGVESDRISFSHGILKHDETCATIHLQLDGKIIKEVWYSPDIDHPEYKELSNNNSPADLEAIILNKFINDAVDYLKGE